MLGPHFNYILVSAAVSCSMSLAATLPTPQPIVYIRLCVHLAPQYRVVDESIFGKHRIVFDHNPGIWDHSWNVMLLVRSCPQAADDVEGRKALVV